MRSVVAALLFAIAVPVAAQEVEQYLLPVEPSVMWCSHNAEYVTKLVTWNQNTHAVRAICAGDTCGVMAASAGRELASSAPDALPTFVYLPKSDAPGVRMALMVESGLRDQPQEHGFGELPIARASDFRHETINIVGVRMDPGYRQTLRIFGQDGGIAQVMIRAYDLKTSELIYEEPHTLWPMSTELTAAGSPLRPSLSIECDLSAELPELLHGQFVRIELEPLTPGLKIWSFLSMTDNRTQHFYTITPR